MKDHRVTIRFTKEEYDRLKTQQSLEGYMSTAKYIRHKIFSIPKTASLSSINNHKMTKDLGKLTAQVKKIGINYNQVVKKFNSMPGSVKNAEMIKNKEKQTQRIAHGRRVNTVEGEIETVQTDDGADHGEQSAQQTYGYDHEAQPLQEHHVFSPSFLRA